VKKVFAFPGTWTEASKTVMTAQEEALEYTKMTLPDSCATSYARNTEPHFLKPQFVGFPIICTQLVPHCFISASQLCYVDVYPSYR
jgi:hypothetical protein